MNFNSKLKMHVVDEFLKINKETTHILFFWEMKLCMRGKLIEKCFFFHFYVHSPHAADLNLFLLLIFSLTCPLAVIQWNILNCNWTSLYTFENKVDELIIRKKEFRISSFCAYFSIRRCGLLIANAWRECSPHKAIKWKNCHSNIMIEMKIK